MFLPEFRLRPWEHRGIEPAPFVQFDAVIEGDARRFDVKAREGRVFCRLSDEPDGRVWMLSNPFRGSEDELEPWFRGEVEAGLVMRFFPIERSFSTRSVPSHFSAELARHFHPSNLNLFGPTTFAVATNGEALGQAQEWCGGSWHSFVLHPRRVRGRKSGARVPSIWSRSWNAAHLRRSMAPLSGDFAFRPFGREQAINEPLRWARGSQNELERLFRAACVALIGTAGDHSSLHASRSWSGGRNASQSVRVNLSVYAETSNATVGFSRYNATVGFSRYEDVGRMDSPFSFQNGSREAVVGSKAP